jgi:cation transport regulator ChaB
MPSETKHQRRRAVQDVDQAAVEMAVAPFEMQEAGVECRVDCEQEQQRDDGPREAVAHER